MWFTKDDDGFRGWLPVAKNGALQTGLAASITVTVVDPADAATSAPTVSESGQLAGLYTFLIPSTFFGSSGLGHYSVVAVINGGGVKDVHGEVLRVFAEDFDTLNASAPLTQQQARDAMKLAPTAGAPAAGSVDEHLDDILADTAAIEPLVTANLDVAVSSRAAPGAAMTLTSGERDATAAALLDLAAAVDGATLREWFRLSGAAILGKLSGAGTGIEVFRALDDSKVRITATVDALGNRTLIVTDAS